MVPPPTHTYPAWPLPGTLLLYAGFALVALAASELAHILLPHDPLQPLSLLFSRNGYFSAGLRILDQSILYAALLCCVSAAAAAAVPRPADAGLLLASLTLAVLALHRPATDALLFVAIEYPNELPRTLTYLLLALEALLWAAILTAAWGSGRLVEQRLRKAQHHLPLLCTRDHPLGAAPTTAPSFWADARNVRRDAIVLLLPVCIIVAQIMARSADIGQTAFAWAIAGFCAAFVAHQATRFQCLCWPVLAAGAAAAIGFALAPAFVTPDASAYQPALGMAGATPALQLSAAAAAAVVGTWTSERFVRLASAEKARAAWPGALPDPHPHPHTPPVHPSPANPAQTSRGPSA